MRQNGTSAFSSDVDAIPDRSIDWQQRGEHRSNDIKSSPVVPTSAEIEGVARHLDGLFEIRPDTRGSKIREGVAGFLKSRTRSSEKLKEAGKHRRYRRSPSQHGSTGSFGKERHVSWDSNVLTSSDDSFIAAMNGTISSLGSDRLDSEYSLESDTFPLPKRPGELLKESDGSGERPQRKGDVAQSKRNVVEEVKSHRRHRSFEFFSHSNRRSRLKSVDSYFLFRPGKKKSTPTRPGAQKRWSSEQLSWSFLQKLDLEGRYVDSDNPDEQIRDLAQMLQHNTNILELNLSWNMISDSGACSIADFLSVNKSLRILDLSKNWKMGSKGGVALADALGKNSTLKKLSLMNCKKVGTKAAEAFATALSKNSSLTELSLGDCRIGPQGGVSIADALCTNRTLETINLSQNSFGLEGTRKLAFCLKKNTSLRSLDITACEVGDEGMLLFGATLSYNSSLERLYMCRNNVSNAGATALISTLKENTTLQELDLRDNRVPVGLLDKIQDCLKKNKERRQRVESDVTQPSLKAISEGRGIMREMSAESPAPLPIPFEYLSSTTNNFASDRRLGQGAFGEVFLGIDKTLRRRFAVKRMKVAVFGDEEDAARAKKIFRREIEAFKCFRHPNIARLHAFCLNNNTQGPQCLVFDLAANGSLDGFLKNDETRNKLHWTTREHIAAGIARALKYLHHGDAAHFGSCFHGDIKPHNICLKKDFTPLLIDCGLSCVVPAEDSDVTLSIYGSSGQSTRGTVGYICPTYAENFALGRSQSYTGACDIYSLGVVLCELLTGVLQRSKVDQEEFNIFDRYSEDGRLNRNLEADADMHAGSWQPEHRHKFAYLAMECIRKDPELRPSISDVEAQLSSLSSSAKPWTSGEKNSLAFLFSCPLAWMDNEGSLHPVTKLNVEREMDLVRECVRDSKKDINLSFDAATCDRLQELVSARNGCLHFAGHGMPCSMLVFEDGFSGSQFVSASDLSALIPYREPFKFVFVSACHSEYIGEAFVDAGVKHVLCCEHESELLDDAAATFTLSFYSALCSGYTIKHAFEQGVGAVAVTHNVNESEKFMLLPDSEDHDVPVFDAAELQWEEERTPLHRVSSPIVFEGREILMNKAIATILSRRRLVTLVGNSRVGRSSLALAIAGYIQDRLRGIRHIENIFYVQRRDEENNGIEESLIQPLLDQLIAAGLAGDEKEHGTGGMTEYVCHALSKAKALVIFDDLDGIEEISKRFLRALYEKASKVQVLCVAKQPINFISGAVIEKCIQVGPLDSTSSAKLFGKVCPLADTGPKRERLSSGLLSRESSVGSAAAGKIVNVIHAGFPTQIIQAAKSISEDDLHELLSE